MRGKEREGLGSGAHKMQSAFSTLRASPPGSLSPRSVAGSKKEEKGSKKGRAGSQKKEKAV